MLVATLALVTVASGWKILLALVLCLTNGLLVVGSLVLDSQPSYQLLGLVGGASS